MRSFRISFDTLSPPIWLSVALSICVLGFVLTRYTLPFSYAMEGPIAYKGELTADPTRGILIRPTGIGTLISETIVTDDTGATVKMIEDKGEMRSDSALGYGKTYHALVTIKRPWLHQERSESLSFKTVDIPKLLSETKLTLNADSAFTVNFDAEAKMTSLEGDLHFEVKQDSDGKTFTLSATDKDLTPESIHKAQINWQTPSGIPLPPIELELTVPPTLSANIPLNGNSNLGLAMPVQIDFSEAIDHRETAAHAIRVTTASGDEIAGKWLWFGKQRAQFTPIPGWPASSTIQVTIDPKGLESIRGGYLRNSLTARFSTGKDRRILVYLDRQRVEAIEDGEIVKVLKASTGKSKTPTVTGDFYIYARFSTKTMKSTGLKPGQKGYYEVKDVPFAQYFYEGYAFHGAFWHNSFGQPASHGCINLATQKQNSRSGVNEDAGWLYQWASLGVPVTVYRESPREKTTLSETGAEKTPQN